MAVGIDARDYVNEAAAGAYVAASRTLLPEIHVHHVDDIHLENYHATTTTSRQMNQLRYEPTPPPPPVNFATIVERAVSNGMVVEKKYRLHTRDRTLINTYYRMLLVCYTIIILELASDELAVI